MKLKNILPAFIAVLAMLVSSCSDDDSLIQLDELQVSSSYVAISMDGGQTSITVTAKKDWSISGSSIPSWLTVSDTLGTAGTSTLTFSAEKTINGRNTELVINCNGKAQHINVIQGLATVESATCAQVMAGVNDKSYRVKGICTSIANTTYGNFYMNDGTSDEDLYIYGTVDASGSYNWSKFNIEVGDEVTVEGPKTTYNGVVELKDATFISVSKSLIKVDSLSVSELPSDGGDFTAVIINKGDGLYVDVPEDAKSWLTITGISGNSINFHAAANTAGPRNTVLTFRTYSNNKEYTAQATVSQEGLSGTLDVPFTVEEAIAYANKLGGESTSDYYIKGKVSKVASAFSANYGNGTFWISDDGTYNEDTALDFEVYRALWLGNQKWVDGNAPISEGDEVVICGHITLYKGTAETASGKAYVYSVNGCQSDENGVGSEAAPFNTIGAIAAANAGCTSNVYVQGIISKILYSFSADYGTATFWISDDGTSSVAENGKSTSDTAHDFEAYSVYYLNNQPWTDADPQIAAGDKVVLYGQLTVYKGTAETNSKKAYVYSHIPAN